jgi:hypothetical protein
MYSTNPISNFKKINHVSLKFVMECVRTRTKNSVIYFQTLIHKNKLNMEQSLPVNFKTFLDMIAIIDAKICDCCKTNLVQ